jgi:GMC oxidoreductase
MGTEPGSVLDAQLRVRGVAGLWVADASALPRIPRANTNALRSWSGLRSRSGSAARTSYLIPVDSIPVDSFRHGESRVTIRT